MKRFKEQLNRASEIREFYILAEKYGFKDGNPETNGYRPDQLRGLALVLHARDTGSIPVLGI